MPRTKASPAAGASANRKRGRDEDDTKAPQFFKERGARFALLSLTAEQKKIGVIAASAGNHALALSYHGLQLGIPVVVVMPKVAPIMKVSRCESYKAEVIIHGAHIGESKTFAADMGQKRGLKYINGYDDDEIIAGQGTIGVELLEQMEDIDAVVVPIGGGGLIAGIALAVKTLAPDVKVYGIEAASCPSWQAAIAAGKPVPAEVQPTLADGLAVPVVGSNAFAIGKQYVDKVISVSERWIAVSILHLLEDEKCVIEGGGATGLAACLGGYLPELNGKRVVVILCGGNIDTTVLGRCIERGMAAVGRLIQMQCVISDTPGGMARLTKHISKAGASIKVRAVLETRDWDSAYRLSQVLKEEGYNVEFGETTQAHFDEIARRLRAAESTGQPIRPYKPGPSDSHLLEAAKKT